MIRVDLSGLGKRYARRWVFRDLADTFTGGETIGISGSNGSGKSTLLRLLAGQLTPSRGEVTLAVDDLRISASEYYRFVSWTGPYLEVPEELTIAEFLDFHFGFKPLAPGLSLDELPERLGLAAARNRRLTDCSSGMRQRVLLGSALYAATPLLLLDEPTVTLDAAAVDWFHTELADHRADRLVFIASNDPEDLRSCSRIISL